ncbi:MAG: hypothetical protein WBB25_11410 [Sulfitobacter sp.]
MTQNKLFRASLFVPFLLGAPIQAFAGDSDVGIFEPGFVLTDVFPSTDTQPQTQNLAVASNSGTAFVTQGIADAYRLCANLPQKEYTVDCLGERMAELAETLPDAGDYVEAKAVLEDTAQKLRSVARRNRSATKPVARVRSTVRSTPVVTAPLTPVKTEAVEASLAEAVQILDEAETTLLRSTGSSDRRKVHYQAMAAAVGSNKILLRST